MAEFCPPSKRMQLKESKFASVEVIFLVNKKAHSCCFNFNSLPAGKFNRQLHFFDVTVF